MVRRMSLESVRAFFAERAPDIEVIVTEASSATVALAAAAHGVEPAQIAKTICLRVGEKIMLIVAGGTARLDNRKFKDRFGGKARMLDAEDVMAFTSHPVGGVCPFGLPGPLPSIATCRSCRSKRSCRPPAPPMRRCACRRNAWPGLSMPNGWTSASRAYERPAPGQHSPRWRRWQQLLPQTAPGSRSEKYRKYCSDEMT